VDRFFFSLTTRGDKAYFLYYRVVFPLLSRVSTWWVHVLLTKKVPPISGIADNLMESASNTDELKTLLTYVETRVKRLPLRGWLSPEEVHFLKYGDCKHMSVLLSELLSQRKRDSKIVVGFLNWKGVFTKNIVSQPRHHVWVKVEGSPCCICDPSLHYCGPEKEYENLVNGSKEMYYLDSVVVTDGKRKIQGRRLYVEES
jgi:transglutaminase-like putative cysteine protease